ncbi:hypothetical protein OY671_012440, partial [Metschnikowia pulcherrima]
MDTYRPQAGLGNASTTNFQLVMLSLGVSKLAMTRLTNALQSGAMATVPAAQEGATGKVAPIDASKHAQAMCPR